MALGDRIKEFTTTTGSGVYFLDGTIATFQTFIDGIEATRGTASPRVYSDIPFTVIHTDSAINNIDVECGRGTLTAGVGGAKDKITRDRITFSSNGNQAVSWGDGSKVIVCAPQSFDVNQWRYDVLNYGASGLGVADDLSAIQAAVDAAASGRGTVYFPAGTYIVTDSINVSAGNHIHLDADATIKSTQGTTGWGNAVIKNADYTTPTKIDGFKLTGYGTIQRDTAGTGAGPLLGLYGDNMLIENVTLGPYESGQALIFAGDNCRVNGITVTGSADAAGTGGIRFVGGDNMIATGCHVVSGDDALQFVPVPPSNGPNADVEDLNITNSAYIGCTGHSTEGRFMSVLLVDDLSTPTEMTNSIFDVSFIGCSGIGENRAIAVMNYDSSGSIRGVHFTNCTVTGQNSSQGQLVQLYQSSYGGTTSQITFQNCAFGDCTDNTINHINCAAEVTDVIIVGCTFQGTSAFASIVCNSTSLARWTIRDCLFDAKGLLWQNGTDVIVDGCRFINVPASQDAINFAAAENVKVSNCYFHSAETTADAIRLATITGTLVMVGNDMEDCGTTPVNNSGNNIPTFNEGNVPEEPLSITESFGSTDATPSVSSRAKTFKTANAGATTITDFDGGFRGQVIQVIIGDANTTIDFTASGLQGNVGVDWSPIAGDHMTCIYDGTDWLCSVSDNTA